MLWKEFNISTETVQSETNCSAVNVTEWADWLQTTDQQQEPR